MSHDDAMRGIRLMGEDVLPAVREIGEELGLDERLRDRPGDEPAVPHRRRAEPRRGGSMSAPQACVAPAVRCAALGAGR